MGKPVGASVVGTGVGAPVGAACSERWRQSQTWLATRTHKQICRCLSYNRPQAVSERTTENTLSCLGLPFSVLGSALAQASAPVPQSCGYENISHKSARNRSSSQRRMRGEPVLIVFDLIIQMILVGRKARHASNPNSNVTTTSNE